MYFTRTFPLWVCAVLLACGGDGNSPSLADQDVVDVVEADEGLADTCQPSCEGRECGTNSCGGECGQCRAETETCSQTGQCVSHPCSSSKDCPGALVCAKTIGQCVMCVGDEDCAEGTECGGDHICHEITACQSDKDCKELGLVCDKQDERCVQCLAAADCPGNRSCQDHYCIDAVCQAGETKCDGDDVLACAADGTGWGLALTCTVSQFCQAGECQELTCIPNNIWCEGSVYTVCSEDGKSVKYEEDCAAQGLNCFQTGCIEGICDPMSKFCVDNSTKGLCSLDGMEFEAYPCQEQHYCQEGQCLPWVCTPGQAWCDANIAKLCNAKGSQVQSQTNCGDKICVDGQCLGCQPDCQDKQCGDDGCGGSCGACQVPPGVTCATQPACEEGLCTFEVDQFFCLVEDSCVPSGAEDPQSTCRKCQPNQNQLGWTSLPEGTYCGVGLTCHEGMCCNYDCTGKKCGADGCGGVCGTCPEGIGCFEGQCSGCEDGNDIDWDGCTGGQITEFQVNTVVMNDQYKPAVAVGANDDFLIVWQGGVNSSVGNGFDIYGRLFSTGGQPKGPDFLINTELAKLQHSPVVAHLTDGRWVVVWETHPGSCGANQPCASIWGQLLNADGAHAGGEFKISSDDGSGMTDGPVVQPFADGGFLTVWTRDGQQKKVTKYQLFDAQGAKAGPEMEVGGYQGEHPAAATFSDGGFVLAWTTPVINSKCNVQWLEFSSNALPIATPALAAEIAMFPSLDTTVDGAFVLAWQFKANAVTPNSIWVQLLSQEDGVVGQPFEIGGLPDASPAGRPSVVFFPGGSFVVAWPAYLTGNDQSDIGIQRLDSDGDKEGLIESANTYTQDWQGAVVLAPFSDGGLVAVWQSKGQDGSGMGVYAQKFDKNGYKVVH